MLEMMSALVRIEETGLPLLGRADRMEGAGAGLPLLGRADRTEGQERHAASRRRCTMSTRPDLGTRLYELPRELASYDCNRFLNYGSNV